MLRIILQRPLVVALIVVAVGTSPASFVRAATLEWVRQFGEDDRANAVSADQLGNVFVGGSTQGNVYLNKLDSAGQLQWTRQFGTAASRDNDCWGVSADGLGNVYIAGYMRRHPFGDGFLSKFDSLGNMLWTQEVSTPYVDEIRGVSADGLGNVYITGGVYVNPGQFSSYLAKYDSEGILLWTQSLETSPDDLGFAVSADTLGNVFVTGTSTNINRGAFVSKYDASGALAWTQRFASSGASAGQAVSADGFGNVYVTGSYCDHNSSVTPFVSRLDGSGAVTWTREFEPVDLL